MAKRDLIGRTLGDYVVREQIGKGGGGLVFRGQQRTLNRDLVIKVLPESKQDSCSASDRFLREARLASQASHPYAAHIYDFGDEPDGLQWIAMEHVCGETLQHWLQHHGPMTLERFVPFFERLAEVVNELHAISIVHRDIKPSNVMVVEDHSETLLPKLLDFGIAKGPVNPPVEWPDGSLDTGTREAPHATGEGAAPGLITQTDPNERNVGVTPPGAGIGSTPYMSPEQKVDSASVDSAADLYSLGVLAYQALYGTLPPEPASYPPGALPLPESPIDRVLVRAMAYWPKDRYPTALSMAADLRAVLQASEREQLRVATRQWEAGGHAPGLLWGLDMVARFERWTSRVSWRALDASELAFIAASQRRAKRAARSRRITIGLAVAVAASVLGSLVLYMSMRQKLAEQTAIAAEQHVTQLEVEQGRAALVENSGDAKTHLLNAYRRGEHSDGTKFMLARALHSDRAQLATLPGRADHAWSARFSPGGDLIATTDDQAAQLWDARTYQLRFTLPHGDVVYDALFSRDGTTLYTACGDGSVGIWNVATGTRLNALRARGRSKHYVALALSPDEQAIAAIDIDGGAVDVWDPRTSAQLTSLADEGIGYPFIAFAANGSALLTTGGSDLRIFDTRSWELVGNVPNVRRFSIDPASARLVAAGPDGELAMLSIPEGKTIRPLGNAGGPIEAVSFSPDGARIASAAKEQTRVWDAATGTLQMRIFGRRSRVTSLEFDQDSRLVLLGANDGSATIIDAVVGVARDTYMSTGLSTRAHFSPDAQRIVAASYEGFARVWSTSSSYFQWGAKALGSACQYLPPTGRRFIALGCPGSDTKVWDLENGQIIAELPGIVDEHAERNSYLAAVSVDGSRAAVARGDHVELYELPSKHLLQTIHLTADANVVSFGLRRSELVIGDIDGGVSVATDHELASLPEAGAAVDAIEVLRNRIVVASADGRLEVYDLPTRRIIARLSGVLRVIQMKASADESRLVTVSTADPLGKVGDPPFVTLWNLDRGTPIRVLDSHYRLARAVGFVNGDREVITSGAAIQRWSASTGQLIREYRGGGSYYLDAAMMPDQRTIVAGRGDGGLRFWDSATGQQLWETPALSASVLAVTIWNENVVTVGTAGEISGWKFPNPDQDIEVVRTPGLSCKDEASRACP